MKLEDAERHYVANSGKLSDIVRNLGLVGLAAVWFFKTELPHAAVVPRILLWVGGCLLLALVLDAAQYLASWASWRGFHKSEGKRLWAEGWKQTKKEDGAAARKSHAIKFVSEARIGAPSHINAWPERMLYAKTCAVALGYVLLFAYLIPQLFY